MIGTVLNASKNRHVERRRNISRAALNQPFNDKDYYHKREVSAALDMTVFNYLS